MKALVLNSGGMDSAVVLKWATLQFGNVYSIAFDYGQRNYSELNAALNVADALKVEHRVIKLSDLERLGGSLFKGSLVPLEEQRPDKGLASTVIPGRNVIFLTYAAAFADSLGTQNVVAGLNARTSPGVPDQSQHFANSLETVLNAGMPFRGAVDGRVGWKLHTPIIDYTKADIIRLMVRLGGFDILKHTITCYEGETPGCMRCLACQPRMAGFLEAGLEDPAVTEYNRMPF